MSYDLVLFGAQDFLGGRGGAFLTIEGGTKTTSGDNGGSAFVDGNSYIRYDGLTSSSGQIVVTFSNGPEGIGIFNGFQIENLAVVPEPSTLILSVLGLMSLGFIGWRRRRR